MKFIIQFENDQEILDIFENVISNGALGYMQSYGFEIEMPDYDEAKKFLKSSLPNTDICYENVVMAMLSDGGGIHFIDEECDGEYSRILTEEGILQAFKSNQIPSHLVKQMHDEDYDAETCDQVLQYILFGELVFS